MEGEAGSHSPHTKRMSGRGSGGDTHRIDEGNEWEAKRGGTQRKDKGNEWAGKRWDQKERGRQD